MTHDDGGPVHTKHHGGTFAKRCKHFAGIDFTNDDKTCNAGVRLKDVFVMQPYKYRYGNERTVYTSNYAMPCFRDDDPCGVCQCDKREFPTSEEVEAHRKEMEAVFDRTMVAREAIVEATGNQRGAAGAIDCPVCRSGKLRYTVAGINGHIHASCTTEGCVRWME